MAFEPRVRACFEIKALSPQEGWLPFKDLATQRSEQGRMRGDAKTMRDGLPAGPCGEERNRRPGESQSDLTARNPAPAALMLGYCLLRRQLRVEET